MIRRRICFTTFLIYDDVETFGLESCILNDEFDAIMDDDRATEIINYLSNSDDSFRVKFIKENNDSGKFIRDKSEHVLTEARKGSVMVISTNESRPIILTGSDKPYYYQMYPVIVLVYCLFAIKNNPELKNYFR